MITASGCQRAIRSSSFRTRVRTVCVVNGKRSERPCSKAKNPAARASSTSGARRSRSKPASRM